MSGSATAASRDFDVRVAHLNTNTSWGGGENQLLQLLTRSVARGLPVDLWAVPDGALARRARDAGVRCHALPKAFRRTWWAGGCKALAADLAAHGVGLIHAHDSEALTLGIRARALLHVPLVYHRRVASPIRRGLPFRSKYTPNSIDAVIAISETVRRVMARTSRYPIERIHVAPTGVDTDALDRAQPDLALRAACGGRWLAGGLGRLSKGKNWGLLIETAARLRDEWPDLRWIIAGDGPEGPHLAELAQRLGVADRVSMPGFLPEGARVLKSLDLLFFPSLREGASVTIREAMVLGVPVAAVDAPGSASMESLGGHGWALRPGDVDGAAAAVGEILRDDALRTRRVAAARASARERFSFTRTLEDTLAVYRHVLRARPQVLTPANGGLD